MPRTVVTTGYAYADIDAFAGIVAYAELLRAQGKDAVAICHAPLNESVTPELEKLAVQFSTKYDHKNDDQFVLVDFSDPRFLEKFVEIDKVIEVIDHHVGFEKLWHDQIGNKAYIEFIGAASTLVAELWEQAGHIERLNPSSARLLAAGILDNTLNFGATITTQRDHDAFDNLAKIADIDASWIENYFRTCQNTIEQNVTKALKNDYKILSFSSGLTGETCFGQAVLWDAEEFLRENTTEINNVLSEINSQWFMNLIDLKDGCSYFMSDNETVKSWLESLLGVQFEGNVAKANRMWLRKEVIKADFDEKDRS